MLVYVIGQPILRDFKITTCILLRLKSQGAMTNIEKHKTHVICNRVAFQKEQLSQALI